MRSMSLIVGVTVRSWLSVIMTLGRLGSVPRPLVIAVLLSFPWTVLAVQANLFEVGTRAIVWASFLVALGLVSGWKILKSSRGRWPLKAVSVRLLNMMQVAL